MKRSTQVIAAHFRWPPPTGMGYALVPENEGPKTSVPNPLRLSLRSLWTGAWLYLMGLAAAQGGTFSTDFNAGQPAGTSVQGTATVDVSGGVGDSGVLKLTEASVNQRGSFIIEDLDAGQRIGSF